ncbi:MAG: DUF3098 domain-containing protein [Bacteroidales bacterium]|nr:DUF3098 domain-containing protein [Bacteroidales bacterium]
MNKTAVKNNATENRTFDESTYFALPKKNVKYLIAGFAVMLLGYIFLSGGGSSDPKVFSSAMFGARYLVVAPLLILSGMALVIISIMKRNLK